MLASRIVARSAAGSQQLLVRRTGSKNKIPSIHRACGLSSCSSDTSIGFIADSCTTVGTRVRPGHSFTIGNRHLLSTAGVEVTKTESASSSGSSGSGGRTPIGNAGGADANRPSISTEESTCSHGISTDPTLLDKENDEEDEMEDMFVEPHACLGTDEVEWGGPRRGGKLEEPTRFGDWERKGRCTDF